MNVRLLLRGLLFPYLKQFNRYMKNTNFIGSKLKAVSFSGRFVSNNPSFYILIDTKVAIVPGEEVKLFIADADFFNVPYLAIQGQT